jgi:hypothetical protein
MHAVHNAQVQLIATMLNHISVAFIVVGFVGPLITGQLVEIGRALVTLAWIGLGIGLHSGAQPALRRLRQ